MIPYFKVSSIYMCVIMCQNAMQYINDMQECLLFTQVERMECWERETRIIPCHHHYSNWCRTLAGRHHHLRVHLEWSELAESHLPVWQCCNQLHTPGQNTAASFTKVLVQYRTLQLKQHHWKHNVAFLFYFARASDGKVLWWARLCVCMCVCVCASVCMSVCLSLSTKISPKPCARSISKSDLQGHSRALALVPFDRPHTISY